MNILITGSCGTIGSMLVRSIPDEYKLTCVDNFRSNKQHSLFDLNRKITFIEDDYINIDMSTYDIVIHLAAITDAADSINNPELYYFENYEKPKLWISKNNFNGVFIFTSTTSVYGENKEIVDENSRCNPQSPYAYSKILFENWLSSYKIKHIILRLGTIFGYSPGIRFHTAINKFFWQAIVGQPLTIWKQNIKMFRPYLGINDCCKAINLVIDKIKRTKDSVLDYKGKYNVLSCNLSLEQIISLIESLRKVKIQYVDTPLINQYSYIVNDDKFKLTFDFIPEDNIKSLMFDLFQRMRLCNE